MTLYYHYDKMLAKGDNMKIIKNKITKKILVLTLALMLLLLGIQHNTMKVEAKTEDYFITFNGGMSLGPQPDGVKRFDMTFDIAYSFMRQELILPYTYFELYFVSDSNDPIQSEVITSELMLPGPAELIVIDLRDYLAQLNPRNVAGTIFLTLVTTDSTQVPKENGYIEINYQSINLNVSYDDKINPELVFVESDQPQADISWVIYQKENPSNVIMSGEGPKLEADVFNQLSDNQYTIDYTASMNTIHGIPITSTASTDFLIDRTLKKGTLTVNYVDDHNEIVHESQVFKKSEGTTQTIDIIDIQDYEFIGEKNAESLDIEYTDQNQTRTLVYKHKQSSLTVNYEDESGEIIKEPDIFIQDIHSNKTVVAPKLQGYQYVRELNNLDLDVKFLETDQIITLVYNKEIVEEITPPTESIVPEDNSNTSSNNVDSQINMESQTEEQKLPHTGLNSQRTLYFVLIIVSFTSLFFLIKRLNHLSRVKTR